MGRYYSGDIEGKFWFGVQSSRAADRFGSTGCDPNYVEYYFDRDNLEEIKEELKNIEDNNDIKKIEEFFNNKSSYRNEEVSEANITHKDLEEYADLLLGRKILEQVEKYGECNFTAEL